MLANRLPVFLDEKVSLDLLEFDTTKKVGNLLYISARHIVRTFLFIWDTEEFHFARISVRFVLVVAGKS